MSTYDQRYVLRNVTQEEALVRIFSNQSPEKRVLQFRTREMWVSFSVKLGESESRIIFGGWSKWQDVREEAE